MFTKDTNAMQTNQLLDQIVGLILKNYNNEECYFESPIEIQATPHTPAISIWGIAISPIGEIWLCTVSDEPWHKLEASDINYTLVISSLYQRVTFLFGNKKVA